MTGSLNELETLVKRATRGAGLSWGIAEEAGKSARWLASRGFPAGALVFAWLQQGEQVAYRERVPADPRGTEWKAGASFLCPVCTGCVLSDRATAGRLSLPLRLREVLCPLLFLPFLEGLSRKLGHPVQVEGPPAGATVLLDAEDGWRGERLEALGAVPTDLYLRAQPGAHPPRVERFYRVDWDAEEKAGLEAFAHRTFAPASIGHQSGAGAGLRDND